MFELRPFKREHLEPMAKQKINGFLGGWIESGAADDMAKELSFTGFVKDEVMVCGGVNKLWQGRGNLWSIWSESCRFNFVPVFRGIQRFLDQAPYVRLEMAVPCDLELGHRRAKMLGFELECERARLFLPNGLDCSLYARIKQMGVA